MITFLFKWLISFDCFGFLDRLCGPDIQRLFADVEFSEYLMEEEYIAWENLKAVINNVLGIDRSQHWRTLVIEMLKSFNDIGVKMSLKEHFLHQHLDELEALIPTESDQRAENFHKVTGQLECWYSAKRLNSVLANLCWKCRKKS